MDNITTTFRNDLYDILYAYWSPEIESLLSRCNHALAQRGFTAPEPRFVTVEFIGYTKNSPDCRILVRVTDAATGGYEQESYASMCLKSSKRTYMPESASQADLQAYLAVVRKLAEAEQHFDELVKAEAAETEIKLGAMLLQKARTPEGLYQCVKDESTGRFAYRRITNV